MIFNHNYNIKTILYILLNSKQGHGKVLPKYLQYKYYLLHYNIQLHCEISKISKLK